MSYSLSDVCDLQKTAESTIDDWYRYLSGRSLNKVEYFSSVLCGSVYELSALGEGVHGLYDQFPLYRLDAFDCQTFVETVLALAWADSFSLFLKNKCFISYRGRDVDFFNRTHFICLDWRHLFRGLLSLVDITADCVRKFPMLNLRVSSVDIDRHGFSQKPLRLFVYWMVRSLLMSRINYKHYIIELAV